MVLDMVKLAGNYRNSFLAVVLIWLSFDTFAQQWDLYVVDIGPDRLAPWQVLKYDQNGENPEVFIDSQLNGPQDIIFLESLNQALVSNYGSNKITRYHADTGEYIDDFATGINGPTRITVGPDNLLYVLQWAGNGRVLRYKRDGTFVDEFTQVGVSNSIGLDWDKDGNLYVSSFDAGHVRKFDQNGNDLGLFISTNLTGPTNIWFDSSGNLLVLDWTAGVVRRFSSDGGFMGNFITGLNEPEGKAFLDNGNFLIGNGGTGSVKEYQSNGVFVRDFVSSGLGGLVKPNGLRIRHTGGVAINPGLNDAWFNPATPGQGFFLTVFEDIQIMFLTWFTYDTQRPGNSVTANLGEPGHRWITASGPYEGSRAELDITITQGGVFDSVTPAVSQQSDGTIIVTIGGCNEGTVRYEITSLGLTGVVPIERIALDNVPLCEQAITH